MVFRPLQLCDREEIQRIHEECFPVRYNAKFFDNAVKNVLADGRPLFSHVACLPLPLPSSSPPLLTDSIVGCIISQFQSSQKHEHLNLLSPSSLQTHPLIMYIMTLATTQDYRRTGLASLLLKKLIQSATSNRNCGLIYLHVITYNTSAIKFYEKNRFERLGICEGYYCIEGKYYDSYLYVRYVNGGERCRSWLDSVDEVINGFIGWFGL
ncbi:hypothetical protein TL16_g02026 [Triparma laevis f. inornata]|uniref:N-alpha-acetyltransferase 60 n=1 Tax=Triparma laevis f. inornata TaxID=1714386 RepID=A0A9W6ZPZ1_9STRA|nr:hypothetical protein TL16_g02026 [Triparma laevis f. inornata]